MGITDRLSIITRTTGRAGTYNRLVTTYLIQALREVARQGKAVCIILQKNATVWTITERTFTVIEVLKMYELICTKCKIKFNSPNKSISLCLGCFEAYEKQRKAERRKLLNRPLTPDTEFLVCVYTYRGDSIKRIAEDLIRIPRNVQKILNEARASGRYEKYIKIYKARGLQK